MKESGKTLFNLILSNLTDKLKNSTTNSPQPFLISIKNFAIV